MVFQRFVKILSEKFYASYPRVNGAIPNEPIVNRFAREAAIRWACQSGNEDCLYDTYALVHLVGHHDGVVPKGLEELIYCNGLRGNESQSEWVWMWQKMQASTDKQERSLIIRSLGCSDDFESLADFLASSFTSNSDVYLSKERLEVFKSVLKSSVGVRAAVNFLEKYENDGLANT